MDLFDEQIERLRESGIDLALSDVDIDLCILEALKQIRPINATQKRKRKNRSGNSPVSPGLISRCPRYCRICCKISAILFVLFMALAMFLAFSPESQKWLEIKLDTFIYPITRNWRLITLPLARNLDMQSLYTKDCLLPNPFAVPEAPPCSECERVTREHELYDVTPRQFENNYKGRAQMLVIREFHRNVTFEDLQQWYKENIDTFFEININLQKQFRKLTTLQDVLETTGEDVLSDPEFYIEWSAAAVHPSRMLRKLFPRKRFITKKDEVNLHKQLLVMNPRAETFTMPTDARSFPNMWYVQGSGKRQLVLSPDPSCSLCPVVNITMANSDVLCYNRMYWRVTSHPVPEDNDINVVFLGSFD